MAGEFITLKVQAGARWWVPPLVWFIERAANLMCKHGTKVTVIR